MGRRNLDQLLKYDPLHEAEQATGLDCHDSEETTALGVLLALGHNEAKQRALEEAGDTTMADGLGRYLSIVVAFGFAEVMRVPFVGFNGIDESLMFMVEPARGLLLVFDTWEARSVNGGRVYYNWKPKTKEDGWRCISSGGWRDDILVGYHDCREAIIHNLTRMDERGDFVTPWVEQPFLWLSHYKEKSEDHKTVRAARIAALPDSVREMIGDGD